MFPGQPNMTASSAIRAPKSAFEFVDAEMGPIWPDDLGPAWFGSGHIMINNAVRYLELGQGQTTRRHLDVFYASKGLSNKLGFADGDGIR